MIEWKGLFANTPYSSANNKAQDDAVVGMQDTIYVTGPGYGGYSANVRVHNASGTVVALIPVSGGGGALSAPAPVRILDDSTTYSYSLEVVRGVVPSDDADKIVIRIVGGASKRYPGQVSTLPGGSTSFAGKVLIPEIRSALTESSRQPLRRIAIIGDSIAAATSTGGHLEYAIMGCGGQLARVVNAGVGGNTLAQMDARFNTDISPYNPHEVWIAGGSNSSTIDAANKAAIISLINKTFAIGARPVVFGPSQKVGYTTQLNTMANWMRAYCASVGVEYVYLWDGLLNQATGVLDASRLDILQVHPLPQYQWEAGALYANSRVLPGYRRQAAPLATNGDANQNSWVIDPYNTTGDAAKGSRWNADNAKVTFSKVASVAPDIGVWQRMSVALLATAGDNSGAGISSPGGLAIATGAEMEISYRLRTTNMSNLSIDAYLEWQNDSQVDVGGGRKSFCSAIQTNVDGTVCYILKAPAGAYRPQIKFKYTQIVSGSAASGDVDVAMIGIRNLSAL